MRLEALGYRQLVPRGSLAAAASVLPPAAPAELHGLLSALLGVPDGAADMPSGECVPHESNLELLGSAAWSKCPLGRAPARLLRLLRARLAALGSSALR